MSSVSNSINRPLHLDKPNDIIKDDDRRMIDIYLTQNDVDFAWCARFKNVKEAQKHLSGANLYLNTGITEYMTLQKKKRQKISGGKPKKK